MNFRVAIRPVSLFGYRQTGNRLTARCRAGDDFSWAAHRPPIESRQVFCSDENDRLEAGDLEAVAAARIQAHQHVVDPDQMIARLGELRSRHIINVSRERLLLGAPDPPDGILIRHVALGAGVRSRFGLLSFHEEIALVHGHQYIGNFDLE